MRSHRTGGLADPGGRPPGHGLCEHTETRSFYVLTQNRGVAVPGVAVPGRSRVRRALCEDIEARSFYVLTQNPGWRT